MTYVNFNLKQAIIVFCMDINSLISLLQNANKTLKEEEPLIGREDYILDLITIKKNFCDTLTGWEMPTIEFIKNNHTIDNKVEMSRDELKHENDMIFNLKLCVIDLLKKVSEITDSIGKQRIEHTIKNTPRATDRMHELLKNSNGLIIKRVDAASNLIKDIQSSSIGISDVISKTTLCMNEFHSIIRPLICPLSIDEICELIKMEKPDMMKMVRDMMKSMYQN